MNLDDGIRATLLIHYYRAMVGRADIWRTRMDATTNWSIGATAAFLSFALGNAASPHYVIHIAAFLTVIFLFLEARRLTFYHLWQQRVLVLERVLIRPATRPDGVDATTRIALEDLERELAPEFGTTIPKMSLAKATARRLRRVYIYLFAVQLLAWLLKLSSHPVPVTSASELVSRAAIGALPGLGTLGVSAVGFLLAAGLAVAMGSTSRRRGLAGETLN
jgi:uncharacterized membrane protein